jgi:hypothetical protein
VLERRERRDLVALGLRERLACGEGGNSAQSYCDFSHAKSPMLEKRTTLFLAAVATIRFPSWRCQ